MRLIDSHVHFWNTDHLNYDWLTGIDALNRSFLPSDYKSANGEHIVDGIVFVEASADNPLEEVKWVETLDAPPIKAIVANAALEEVTGREQLLESYASRPLVKGIRRNYQDEEKGFAEQTSFIEGIRSLKSYDHSFDLCIKSHQLDETIALVRQLPDVQFILDHIAKPAIVDGEFDTWATQLKTLASFENVVCKISGIITEADHSNWTKEQIKPYILETIGAFGIDRVMFGSDWPVVRLAGSYTDWVSALDFAVAELSDNERQKLFIDNAIQTYRIES